MPFVKGLLLKGVLCKIRQETAYARISDNASLYLLSLAVAS